MGDDDADKRLKEILARRERRRTVRTQPHSNGHRHAQSHIAAPGSGSLRHKHHGTTRVAGSLGATLHNPTSLGYFIQYMETQAHATLFVQYWLNTENYAQSMADLQRHEGAQPMGWRRAKTSLQNDALVIYTTYLALDAPRGHKLLHDMAISEGICDSAMLHQRIDRLRWAVEDNICQPGGPDASCFSQSQQLCYTVLESQYYLGYEELRGPFTLQDVLNNPALLRCYIEYMSAADPHPAAFHMRPRDLLQLWLSVRGYKDLFYVTDPDESRGSRVHETAVALYNKYLAPHALCTVDVPSDARLAVEAGLGSELGPPIGCFEAVQRFCFEVMDDVYFAPFLTSEPYERLRMDLGELANQTLGPMATLEPRPAASASVSPAPKRHRDPDFGFGIGSPRPSQFLTAVDALFLDNGLLQNRLWLTDRLLELVPNVLRGPDVQPSTDTDWGVDLDGETVLAMATAAKGARKTHHAPLQKSHSRLTAGLTDQWGRFQSFSTSLDDTSPPKPLSIGEAAAQALGLAPTPEEARREHERAVCIARKIVADVVGQTQPQVDHIST